MFYDMFHSILGAGISLAFAVLPTAPLLAQKQQPPTSLVKNIVLVHGAFADGTSWSKIIPLLESKGYHVVAVQNPLTSLADDVAATKRIIALQDGPVILVGHSWGGAVITQAGDDPKVAGLVYVAAYAPEAGQSANDASTPFGLTEGQKQIRVQRVSSTTSRKAYPWPSGNSCWRYRGKATGQCSLRNSPLQLGRQSHPGLSFRQTIACFNRPWKKNRRRGSGLPQ